MNTSSNPFRELQHNGFKVVGKYIYKRSETNNKNKVVGHVNEKNFWFYSENVYPFKGGLNFFNEDNLKENKKYLKEYFTKVKENDRNDFKVSFEKYLKTTKEDSIFTNWISNINQEFKNEFFKNYFDIRGVSSGYLEDAAVFPFFDFDNNFVTAQIIKYGKDGKRIKRNFSENWYHSYKPIIRKDLGFKNTDVYKVRVSCFFGENYLNGSDNIVGVVEAPKTAVILKELYPNIDWIATAGEPQIKSKSLKALKNKTVVLFPDAHTTLWKDFANDKGFYCSDILENEFTEKGDDLADYVFNTESDIFSKVHEYLYSLNIGEFDLKLNTDSLKLDYKVTGNDTNYFISVPTSYKNKKVINQIDNSVNFKIDFKGKKFDLYNDKFELYNAQIDWHKAIIEDGQIVKPSEKLFLFNLQKCFRILKELNPEIYLNVFKKVIRRFNDSNYTFNHEYILRRLVPLWDKQTVDLIVFKKQRKWKYKGSISLSKKEFNSQLNDHKFQQRLQMRLLSFSDVIEENRFIDIQTDLALSNNIRGYSKIKNLVNDWNSDVIGCKTLKTYSNKIDFITKISNRVKIAPPYINGTIYSGAYFTRFKISIAEAMRITENTNNKAVRNFLNFRPNEPMRASIKNQVLFMFENVTDAIPIRQQIGDTQRIYDFEVIENKVDNADVLSMNLNYSDAFATLENLKDIDRGLLSESQSDWFDYEFSYLSLLENINNLSYFERKDTFKDIKQRSKLIKKHYNRKFLSKSL